MECSCAPDTWPRYKDPKGFYTCRGPGAPSLRAATERRGGGGRRSSTSETRGPALPLVRERQINSYYLSKEIIFLCIPVPTWMERGQLVFGRIVYKARSAARSAARRAQLLVWRLLEITQWEMRFTTTRVVVSATVSLTFLGEPMFQNCRGFLICQVRLSP